MRTLFTIAFGAILLIWNLQASAGYFLTGNMLQGYLQKNIDKDSSDGTWGIGLGYVEGVVDAYEYISFCAPSEGVTAGQVAAIVLKYMNEHPETLNKAADQIVNAALRPIWPCPKEVSPRTEPKHHKKKPVQSTPSDNSPF